MAGCEELGVVVVDVYSHIGFHWCLIPDPW